MSRKRRITSDNGLPEILEFDAELCTMLKKYLVLSQAGKSCFNVARKYAKRFEGIYGTMPIYLVSPEEIYIVLLLDHEDKKDSVVIGPRICGQKKFIRVPDSDGCFKEHRCLNSAGASTGHVGFGRCQRHDRLSLVRSPLNLLQGIANEGMAISLNRALQLYPEMLDDTSLSSLKEEIVTSRYLLGRILQVADSPGLIGSAQSMLETIGKLKAAQSKIVAEKYTMTPQVLELFVLGIVEVAKKVLPTVHYSKFMEALYTEIRLPINPATRLLAEAEIVDDPKELREKV